MVDEKLAVFENVNTEENFIGEPIDISLINGNSPNQTSPQSFPAPAEAIVDNTRKSRKGYNSDISKNNDGDNKKTYNHSKTENESKEEAEFKELVIIKKVSKNKGYGYKKPEPPPKVQTPTIEEPEKILPPPPVKEKEPEISLEEALKPTPIITPVTRSSKDLSKRKKSVKKDNFKADNLQVDSQNFPALGQPSTPDIQAANTDSKASPVRSPVKESPAKPAQPSLQRQPAEKVRTMYNSTTSVLSMLDAS